MKKIYKYPLPCEVIQMPAQAEIVHVQFQGHPGESGVLPTLWAWVPTELSNEDIRHTRQFQIIPTGFVSVEDDTKHLATHVDPTGLVWHLVEQMR